MQQRTPETSQEACTVTILSIPWQANIALVALDCLLIFLLLVWVRAELPP